MGDDKMQALSTNTGHVCGPIGASETGHMCTD